jgi:hypothetical protein
MAQPIQSARQRIREEGFEQFPAATLLAEFTLVYLDSFLRYPELTMSKLAYNQRFKK